MTVSAKDKSAKDKVEKIQHTLWLNPKTSERLRIASAKTRIPMSTLVEQLVEDHYGPKRRRKADTTA